MKTSISTEYLGTKDYEFSAEKLHGWIDVVFKLALVLLMCDAITSILL